MLLSVRMCLSRSFSRNNNIAFSEVLKIPFENKADGRQSL